MMTSVFHSYGGICAEHPWEVILSTVTLTICFVSMYMVAGGKVCGLDFVCLRNEQLENSDVILLTLTRCLAVIYVYLQIRSLKKVESRYLLRISGIFTLTSSIVYSLVLLNLLGTDFTGLNEALPCFLLMADLSKSSVLAKYALKSQSLTELKANIGEGMANIAPELTLDTIVGFLVIWMGTTSGVMQLEKLSCFFCLSIIVNYFTFITFYPACLTLILELSRGHRWASPKVEAVKENKNTKDSNLVTWHVKIIMCFGLALVHFHSGRMSNDKQSGFLSLSSDLGTNQTEPSPMQVFIAKIFTTYTEYGVSTFLAVMLTLKYLFIDERKEKVLFKTGVAENIQMEKEKTCQDVVSENAEKCLVNTERNSSVLFSLGGDEDSCSDEEMCQTRSISTQTGLDRESVGRPLSEPRCMKTCLQILQSDKGADELTDDELILLVQNKHIPAYKLEDMIGDLERGVNIRRKLLSKELQYTNCMRKLPYERYEYKYVNGACCENVLGYIPVPVGYAGPLLLNGDNYHVPMATTEGCLVASTNRGCRAISQGTGVTSSIINDGMTRGPIVRFPSSKRASDVKSWLSEKDNFKQIKQTFDGSSRFARLSKVQTAQAGRNLFLRFVAKTGDAMGMNMVSKGSEKALVKLTEVFSDMEIISLSGNYCTDKKPAAINWIEGRGKSVVCDASIPGHVVKNVLKTSARALVEVNINKTLIGSAMAGSIGGFNAHAANVVTAIFIATGQDPAQCVTSSNCITLMETCGPTHEDLYISCTMPSIEIGTIGGGTVLPPQAACLEMLGVNGSCDDCPGQNARKFASIICATVLAGELSLMSALAAGHLVRSHLKHNRSTVNMSPSHVARMKDDSAKSSYDNQNIKSSLPNELSSQSATTDSTNSTVTPSIKKETLCKLIKRS